MSDTYPTDKQSLLNMLLKRYSHYNLSLLSFIISFPIMILVLWIDKSTNTVFFTIALFIRYACALWVLISVWQLSSFLRKQNVDRTHPVLWVIVMFLPLANLIAIYNLYGKARKGIVQLKAES